MCGLAGLWVRGGQMPAPALTATAEAMAATLWRRGPDSADCWSDSEAGIALAHRRLAVVDLSAAGAQPMHSACGRYVLTYNGEIYNHAALRRELESEGARDWRGHSDTEVLLALIVLPMFAPPIIFGASVASGEEVGAALSILAGCALAAFALGPIAAAAALRLQAE